MVNDPLSLAADSGYNSIFVRLGTDYKIRNGGYFKTIKNSADQFRYGSFQMARIVEDG